MTQPTGRSALPSLRKRCKRQLATEVDIAMTWATWAEGTAASYTYLYSSRLYKLYSYSM